VFFSLLFGVKSMFCVYLESLRKGVPKANTGRNKRTVFFAENVFGVRQYLRGRRTRATLCADPLIFETSVSLCNNSVIDREENFIELSHFLSFHGIRHSRITIGTERSPHNDTILIVGKRDVSKIDLL
jgi:hypothetical protein